MVILSSNVDLIVKQMSFCYTKSTLCAKF